MSKTKISLQQDGTFAELKLSTDQQHTVEVDVLELDHRYHDNENLQEAQFSLRSDRGLVYEGRLDAEGKATVVGLPPGNLSVRFGPDNRPYEPVSRKDNPDFQDINSEADVDKRVQELLSSS